MSPFYELLAVFEGGRILTFCFVNLQDIDEEFSPRALFIFCFQILLKGAFPVEKRKQDEVRQISRLITAWLCSIKKVVRNKFGGA